MSGEITQILSELANGEEDALNRLLPAVYDQMRQIAASALQREPSNGCDPTELVHETYLRLIGNDELAWNNRTHFFGACAKVIRRILVDQARARHRLKRAATHVNLSNPELVIESQRSVDFVALDEALIELERLAPRQARLIELRFFGGLTEAEAAELMHVSRRTVSTDWAVAKAWLPCQLGDG